jgi:hypothetical protein
VYVVAVVVARVSKLLQSMWKEQLFQECVVVIALVAQIAMHLLCKITFRQMKEYSCNLNLRSDRIINHFITPYLLLIIQFLKI